MRPATLLAVLALAACNGKSDDTNETTDGADGADDGAADGTDGGTDSGADGSADGGADGSADGGADGSADGGADGSADGGADGGTDELTQIEIPVEGYYPEGVAIDQTHGTLYVGSVGTGAIYAASLTDGAVTEVLPAWGAGGSIVGMKYVAGSLWACSSPGDPTSAPSSLVQIDPSTGAVLASYPLDLYTFCNDFVVSSAGDIYVTESYSSVVYHKGPADTALTRWFDDSFYAPIPGGFGFNGVVLTADEGALLVGRMDTGDILRIPIGADGAPGAASLDTIDAPVAYAGIDGMGWKDGVLFAVRDYQLVTLTDGAADGSWVSTPVDVFVDSPTTFDFDAAGDLWLVESQFSKYFDGDDTTNGVPPFRVVKVGL